MSTPTITYSQAPGSTFALGTTTVTMYAEDAAGNATAKTFRVTVVDTRAPILTVNLDNGATTTTTGSVTIALAFSDAVGPARMRFSLDAGDLDRVGDVRRQPCAHPDGHQRHQDRVRPGRGCGRQRRQRVGHDHPRNRAAHDHGYGIWPTRRATCARASR